LALRASSEQKARGYKKIENSSVYSNLQDIPQFPQTSHLSPDKRTPYEHSNYRQYPYLSWHYIVVRGLLSIEPGWKEDELETLPIPD